MSSAAVRILDDDRLPPELANAPIDDEPETPEEALHLAGFPYVSGWFDARLAPLH